MSRELMSYYSQPEDLQEEDLLTVDEVKKGFGGSRPSKAQRNIKRRQGPKRKVSCGIGARRHKRWTW